MDSVGPKRDGVASTEEHEHEEEGLPPRHRRGAKKAGRSKGAKRGRPRTKAGGINSDEVGDDCERGQRYRGDQRLR